MLRCPIRPTALFSLGLLGCAVACSDATTSETANGGSGAAAAAPGSGGLLQIGGSGGQLAGAGGGAAAGAATGSHSGGSAGGSAGFGGDGGDAGDPGGSAGAGMGGGGMPSAGSGGAAGVGSGGTSSDCPQALSGWATLAGDGVSSTTGGGNATPVRPTTAEQLLAYASDATARVIEIEGTFDVPRLQISSNKTLIGIGSNATLRGGLRIRGSLSSPVTNVILRNLRVDGSTSSVDNDAVQLYFAHHVWIDHCEIWDGPDGNLDMTHAVNWVTVSWTKFRYTASYRRPSGETSDHRYSSLIGHSDGNAAEDSGRLKVTFHHNFWAEGVIERMPRVRFGQVHVLNNYFASPGNNYCVRAGRGARLLVEANYFDGVNNPHEFNSEGDEATAHITARGNEYPGAAGAQSTGGGGTPLVDVPYDISVDPASALPELVQRCAGPRP